jgi:diketogulonate reductase-like aldo/keto reductase
MPAPIRTMRLPCGEEIPVLGQGTWGIGDKPSRSSDEIAALELGIELGMTLIDTAETYADGKAEDIVRKVISGRRDRLFIVDRVVSQSNRRPDVAAACNNSLKRLGTDRIDLYLLQGADGSIPLAKTIAEFDVLKSSGKIRHWGVSNLDLADMFELLRQPDAASLQAYEAPYSLRYRAAEFERIPLCREYGVPIIACSPLEQGGLAGDRRLSRVAGRHQANAAQIALAWLLHQDSILAIPKAGRKYHVYENRAALDIQLTPEDLVQLDRSFQPPTRVRLLEES